MCDDDDDGYKKYNHDVYSFDSNEVLLQGLSMRIDNLERNINERLTSIEEVIFTRKEP